MKQVLTDQFGCSLLSTVGCLLGSNIDCNETGPPNRLGGRRPKMRSPEKWRRGLYNYPSWAQRR